jgi:hypothetical protein
MNSEEFYKVKNKLYTKFGQKEVKSSGDTASLYDLKSSIKESLGSYNDFFEKKRKRIKKIFSRNKNLPKINSIDFYNSISGPRVAINFCEFGVTYSLVIHENMMYDLYKDLFSNVPNINKTICRCKKDIMESTMKLREFESEFPRLSYSFSDNIVDSNDVFVYEDDEFNYRFRLSRPEEVHIAFKDKDDFITALSENNGEIYEYVIFYEDEILKKTEININDISNSYFKYFLCKYLGIDKEKTLKM